MPDHPTFNDLIDCHHRPDGPQAARWRTHVESCPSCQARSARMQGIRDLLETAVPEAGREETFRARARFLQAAEETSGLPWLNRLLRGCLRPAPALAAGILIGLLIWGLMLSPTLSPIPDPGNQVAQSNPPSEPTDIPRPLSIQPLSFKGAITRVNPDGSSEVVDAGVQLSAGSTLKMAEDARLTTLFRSGVEVVFETATVQVVRADERDILLDLRAGVTAVDVAPLKSDQSLAVTTPTHKISVRGTRFAVQVTPTGDTLVGVSEGEVLVTPHEPDRPRRIVQPGQAFRFKPDGSTEQEPLAEWPTLVALLAPVPETDYTSPKPRHTKPTPRVAFKASPATENSVTAADLLAEARQAQSGRRFDQALALLDSLQRRFPQAPEAEDALYLSAENQLALGRLSTAVNTLERAERVLTRPSLRENALYTHGYILQDRLARLKQARTVWARYLAEFGDGTLSEEVRFALCRNAQQSGQDIETLHRCRSVADRHPNGYQAPRALLTAADTAYKLERYKEAAQLYDRYLGTGQRDRRNDALYRQGKSLIKVGQSAKATDLFKRFVSLYPRDAHAAEVRGILIGLGEE